MQMNYKVSIIGESSVGKSSIAIRLCRDTFSNISNSTIGACFLTHKESFFDESGSKKVIFEIWDTAGQERYNGLVPIYLKEAHVIIIVFDLTNLISFQKVKNRWFQMFEDHRISNNTDCICCLIGNKSDLKDLIEVKQSDIDEFIKSSNYNVHYYETSAKTGENIKKCFKDLTVLLCSTTNFEKYDERNAFRLTSSKNITSFNKMCCG